MLVELVALAATEPLYRLDLFGKDSTSFIPAWYPYHSSEAAEIP